MPWSNQGGGFGGGGGGNRGPWGQGPSGGGRRPSGGGGGQQPPDLEELLRRSQEKLKGGFPGGGFIGSGKSIVLLVLIALAVWGLTGFYTVKSDEQGVVLRFGEWVKTTQPGLNYHLPYPVEQVITPKVTQVNTVNVGFRGASDFSRSGARTDSLRSVPEESLMLTGDENIVDISFTVLWVIADAGEYLFNINNPPATVKAVAESVMREVIGRNKIDFIITDGRANIEAEVKRLVQETLNNYQAGILVQNVQLGKSDAPEQVIDAFKDVQAARLDQERLQNEAQAYANQVVPEARGQAAKLVQAAEAYKQERVSRAKGEAGRFLSVYEEYKLAKDVTRQRMYLETMEELYSKMNKVVVDDKVGSGVVPFLPLNEMLNKPKGGN